MTKKQERKRALAIIHAYNQSLLLPKTPKCYAKGWKYYKTYSHC